MTFQLHSTCPP